ncbi:MAG: hypothetical protein A2150_07080 [Candidatus Muproteobacteria bacterium RBG_16_64_11]|uniref:Outer membrane protein beta-barrel domain-containing protein n=1 Tax=Candidatus Muproteobacteria bacterium RBG_16_64_11 TaxID=1817758 RepID=A0A1F6TH31_9PROT|nr:MAG: hypothetical protein A2150_07080 [Candidatus Muproteobacteria bacterium RBG_16_64_11]
MPRTLTGLILFAILTPALHAADDIDNLAALGSQANFRSFSEDLAGVLGYKAVAPAAPMGRPGYDLGVQVDSTKLQHPALWDLACGCDASDRVLMPKAYLRLGAEEADLTFSYGKATGSNLALWGVEAQFALAIEGATYPAVALRANYSRLNGVEQLDFSSTGAELAVSKRFGAVAPYAGGGRLWIASTPKAGAFEREKFTADKYYAGVNFALGAHANLALETGKIADTASYSAKFVWRF